MPYTPTTYVETGATTDVTAVKLNKGETGIQSAQSSADNANASIAALPATADAASGTKGITRLSVAPVAAATPIAVGDNDPRMTPTLVAKTASYTPVLADANALLTMDSATAQVFTIPTNASVAYALGTSLEFARFGTGSVTITPAAGVTIPNSLEEAGTTSRTITSRRTSVVVTKIATDTWWLTGSLT